ncbi:glycosyltransferase [soil metagenome]
MAVLATFVGGWGHTEPLLPLIRLAVDHGHTVTAAGQAAVIHRLRAEGCETVTIGPDTITGERRPLVPVDRAKERLVARDHFVGEFGHQRGHDLGRLIERTPPDLVVCDEMDAGAVIAAEVAGVPCVTVSLLAAGRLVSHAVVGPAWDRLRADFGLPPDPLGTRFGGTVRITPAPSSFRDPNVPAPFDLHHVRPPIVDDVGARSAGSRRVYCTIGTVFDVESGDLFSRLVDALSMLDAPSLLTTGNHVARAELPPAPPHVDIEPFVPQRAVLGECAAVICHGGTGTVIAALSLGIPVVVLPMGADQPDNADRCMELGVGIVLDAVDARPADIGEATRAVLTDKRFSRAAARLAAEAAAQPPVAGVSAVLDLFDLIGR